METSIVDWLKEELGERHVQRRFHMCKDNNGVARMDKTAGDPRKADFLAFAFFFYFL